MSDTQSSSRKLPTRQVCARYGVTDRTIARWERDPELKFPQPTIVNHRKYYDDEQLTCWDRSMAVLRAPA
ncbi:MerR family transcriptional regulator [Bradyrhizobium sp. JYMT SZCCT0428]|uniref:MerR family transcriptional regulator n=1 Tax=Bradyrhizobium sp. JYMT SZCCT0428 TaxID=2807673 RepID=UPI001BA61BD1|nr:MerR family transcriptional regulator [Bradyrhizobium sp. JYMT SZCCT0428]MBR1156588.1 MerR family transcriptional regulator [Bradyrhizobium sp. JYMT SZCCT0428]